MFFEVFLVGLLGGISPGPDFFVVMKNSLTYGRRIGSATAFGIGLALIIHVSYTILGFTLIIQKNPTLFKIIQFIGAAYLVWLGINAIRSKAISSNDRLDDTLSRTNTNSHFSVGDSSIYKGFREGFLCNILNPKAALFFLSIFSQFLNPETPYWIQWFYGLEIMIAVGGWFILLATIISSSNFRNLYNQYRHWFNRTLGGVLIYFALRIIYGICRSS